MADKDGFSPGQKRRFDAYMRLASFEASRWNARRRNEWRVSLGIWAFLLVALRFAPNVDPQHARMKAWYMVGAGVAVIGLHTFWIVNVFKRNLAEKTQMSDLLNEAAKLLGRDADPSLPSRYSVVFQLLVTVCLVALVITFHGANFTLNW